MERISQQESSAAAGNTSRSGKRNLTPWMIAFAVFGAQLAFAVVMNGRGYLWGDAISRSSSALIAVHSFDPHLAAIGFVWMPLPTMLEIGPVALYPLWREVVQSGFASSLITVLAGTITALIVYGTAKSLGLPNLLSALYSLIVASSPMLFLFSTNGMSEGVAAPFLIGSVCCLVLFWHDGQRRYIAASGLLLALGFACLYQAVEFGALLLGALVIGLFNRENTPSAPQGRLRAVEGLTILFLVPSAYVGILWVISNAAIMGDPLYFATSIYSNEGYISSSGAGRIADIAKGDILATLQFVALRTLPFALPIAAILLVRLREGRLLNLNSLTMTGLAFGVPFGMIGFQLYDGTSFGWLRYFIYPLYVAAGWGLYEIAKSRHRSLAASIILYGWLLAVPASLIAMANPELGQNEYQVVRSIWTGEHASENGYPLYFDDVKPVSAAVDSLAPKDWILMDSSNAWTIAATVTSESLKQKLLLTSDDRFHDALKNPADNGVRYLLVPDPQVAPQDLINSQYPRLFEGNEPGFALARDFSETGVNWRLFRVEDNASGAAR